MKPTASQKFFSFYIIVIPFIALILAFSVSYGNGNNNLAGIEKHLKDGDLIFQYTRTEHCIAIQLATNSIYSHVGMIYIKNNKTYVLEAVQPVKLTPLNEFIKRGTKSHYVVKRLKDADKHLTESTLKNMKKLGSSYLGKDYDTSFGWSDEKMYCSELVWKIYKHAANIEIGPLM